MSLPGHEIHSPLRVVPGLRAVLRTRYRGEECVSRIMLTPLSPVFSRMIRELALTGRGSIEGLPESIALTMAGYRVRAGLDIDGLAEVVQAGVAEGFQPPPGPDGRPLPAGDYPFVTTRWRPGLSLDQAWPRLAPVQRQAALEGLLELVEQLHAQRVVFGDLKPGNVIVEARGPQVQVALIDLDTMREVASADAPAVTRDLTRRYAAPEQNLHGATFLASDIYAFGVLSALLLGGTAPGPDTPPPRLIEPWDQLVRACLAQDPMARPGAAQLLALVRGHLTRLPSIPGAGDATVRVPEPVVAAARSPSADVPRTLDLSASYPADGPPRPPAAAPSQLPPAGPAELRTERLPEPDASTRPAALAPAEPGPAEAPPPARRSLPARITRTFLLLALLSLVSAAGFAGYRAIDGWRESQVSVERRAHGRQLAEDFYYELRDHKIVAERNTGAVIDELVERMAAQVEENDAPELAGVYALGLIWQQRWHFSRAVWDEVKFAEGDTITGRALAAGHTAEGVLARALLAGAGCRLLPDSQRERRNRFCIEAHRRFDEAIPMLSRQQGGGWLVVEAHWAAEMTISAEARRMRQSGQRQAGELRSRDALAHCDAARALLPEAPVNGKELVEDCVHAAGHGRDLNAFVAWTDWLVEWELGNHDDVRPATALRVFRAAAPECNDMAVDNLGYPRPPADQPPGDWGDWCGYIGLVALGCRDEAQARRPYEFSWFGQRRWLMVDGVPWDTAERASRGSTRKQCGLGG